METPVPYNPVSDSGAPVLCVDLDGTLLRSDMLYETVCLLARHSPLQLLFLPFWLLRYGKAGMKREIARRVTVNPAALPYRTEVLDLMRFEYANGRSVILATATDEILAGPIATHLGGDLRIAASDGIVNCSGTKKVTAIRNLIGDRPFAYAGDSAVDRKVWKEAQEQIVVSSSPHFIKQIRKEYPDCSVIQGECMTLKVFLKAIRIHQWVKNLLVFVPLIMAHQQGDLHRVASSLIAFVAFGLCASSVYLLNDLVDLESDRQHHKKRNRPLASGAMSIRTGILLIPVFLAGSIALALTVSTSFLAVLAVYFAVTLAYSLHLKQLALVDIIVLASLYTIRIIAGGYATSVPVSEWLLGFSLFVFVSLACIKRFSELYSLQKQSKESAVGRGYTVQDLEQVSQLGNSCGCISVLVLALYVNSNEVTRLYSQPLVLWLICPVMLYWMSRLWLLAHRGEVNEDPIVFALSDRTSYVVGLIAVLIMICAV